MQHAEARARELFHENDQRNLERVDRLFAGLLVLQLLASVALALWISPRTWIGARYETHVHVWAALGIGGLLTVYPVWLSLRYPRRVLTRHVIAVAQVGFSALLIHLTGGRIETHFHVFGSLAFLAFYRDWRVLITAALVVAVDHAVRGIYFPQSVFGVLTSGSWRWVEHAGWVVFECVFLVQSCVRGRSEMLEIALRQAELECTNARIEDLIHARTQELEAAKRELEGVCDSVADAVVVADCDGHLVRMNPQGRALFGHDAAPGTEAAEIVGGLLQDDGKTPLPAAKDPLERACSGESLDSPDLLLQRPGHEPLWVKAMGRPLINAAGDLCGGVVVYHDVTKRRAVEDMKDEFISTVSHELRTPMTSINGSLELLLGGVAGELPEQCRSLLEIASRNSKRLVRLISDLLDSEKIAAGKMEVTLRDQELRPILQRCVEDNQGFASKHEVELRLEIDAGVPYANVSSDRLEQVLTNLVSNACKFSPAGGEVVVRAAVESGRVRVSVKDQGPGIPPEFRGRVFEAFAQAGSSTVRPQGGTGLGLSISKALVEAMGGGMGFETETGVGTTFFFDLPLVQDSPRAGPAAGNKASGATTVLVCEPCGGNAHDIVRALRRQGYDCDVAPDLRQASSMVNERDYEALILEPDSNGLELVERTLRQQSERSLLMVNGRSVSQRGLRKMVKAVSSPAQSDAPRVLYVEDDPDLVRVISAQLGEVPVTQASSLARARECLDGPLEFDVVILDVGLPDGSGLELLPRLKELGLATIVFSGQAVSSEVEGRVHAVLLKSNNPCSDLIEAIRDVLAVQSGVRGSSSPVGAPDEVALTL